ncbi:hypothetical protein [Tenacibaculum salmonis]|uniref:hypothetical protein n=1 Tax=Tenacibaculum sp. P3-BQ1 TaxID=3232310 RepID=UPI0034DF51BF
MKPIHKIIGYTPEQFDNLIFQVLFNWAELYSNGCFLTTQKLIVNKQINNWFRIEIRKLIIQYRIDVKPYLNKKGITSKERYLLFSKIISKVFDIYPSVLMHQFKIKEPNVIQKQNFNYN